MSIQCQMMGWLQRMNSKRRYEVAYFMLHPRNYPGGTDRNHEKLSKKNRISGRDSKVGSLENGAIIRSTCLLIQVSYYPAFSFYTIWLLQMVRCVKIVNKLSLNYNTKITAWLKYGSGWAWPFARLLLDMRFSQRWLWTEASSATWRRVVM
jgi:hypothetical protein